MSNLENVQLSLKFNSISLATVSNTEIQLLAHWIEDILLKLESDDLNQTDSTVK